MSANDQITPALIGASAVVVVGLLTWALGQLTSYIEWRRQKADERDSSAERSRAVLHGSFSICNFIAEKLIEWDQNENVTDIARLAVAQPYVVTLIERSPHENEVLSVALFDLGLRLEALLFVVGKVIGEDAQSTRLGIQKVSVAVDELARAVELLQLLLDPDPSMLSEDDIAKIVSNPEALYDDEKARDEGQ